jgi:hypothetical protein
MLISNTLMQVIKLFREKGFAKNLEKMCKAENSKFEWYETRLQTAVLNIKNWRDFCI